MMIIQKYSSKKVDRRRLLCFSLSVNFLHYHFCTGVFSENQTAIMSTIMNNVVFRHELSNACMKNLNLEATCTIYLKLSFESLTLGVIPFYFLSCCDGKLRLTRDNEETGPLVAAEETMA